ncbi:putative multitransmembrane protein [Gottschalkia purinilytica]|uniref:Putative multitransmembrane protein n=1 Tax=Gottschalkia purinilytica TaxID=1503 RepID=A0A0L0W712_GOTPU|nr:YibE/F family protein [Gottschalkia purinilytica]KNF07055.1 putative multitransmembrane protein [Gottschalkia purinilytica]
MRKLHILFMFFLALTLIFPSHSYSEETKRPDRYKAVIIDINQFNKDEGKIYEIQAKISNGPYKDKLVNFEYTPIQGTQTDIELEKGMSIILNVDSSNGKISQISLYDVERRTVLKVLAITFLVLLIIFGGIKGICGAISLIATLLLIVFLLIPLVLKGINPIIATIITSSIAILISFLLISGFSRKSLCAIISTIGGTIIAGLCAFYFGNLMSLTGLSDDHVQTLVAYTDIAIDYRGLLFSGIIIGTIGAVMDVSMSITSFIFEMKQKYPDTSQGSLFESGLNVGRDIMSTMANTLILAYAGASLPLFLFFAVMDTSFVDIINIEFISEEILRSLCGSMGLILTIPLSSFIASIRA